MQILFTIFLLSLFVYFVILRPVKKRHLRNESRRQGAPRRYNKALVISAHRPPPDPFPPKRRAELEDMAGTAFVHKDSDIEPKPEHARAIWKLRVTRQNDPRDGVPGPVRPPRGSGRAHREVMRDSRIVRFGRNRGHRRGGSSSGE